MLGVSDTYKDYFNSLFTKSLNGDMYSITKASITLCNNDEKISDLSKSLSNYLETLEDNGPTSLLWLSYFHAVVIVLRFLEAERL